MTIELGGTAERTLESREFAALYAEVQQFYTHQMRILDARRRAGRRLDHWVGMLDVRPRADGSLRTRCSALAYAALSGGGAHVLYVYVMEDVLVRTGGTWRTVRRRVTRDDLA